MPHLDISARPLETRAAAQAATMLPSHSQYPILKPVIGEGTPPSLVTTVPINRNAAANIRATELRTTDSLFSRCQITIQDAKRIGLASHVALAREPGSAKMPKIKMLQPGQPEQFPPAQKAYCDKLATYKATLRTRKPIPSGLLCAISDPCKEHAL